MAKKTRTRSATSPAKETAVRVYNFVSGLISPQREGGPVKLDSKKAVTLTLSVAELGVLNEARELALTAFPSVEEGPTGMTIEQITAKAKEAAAAVAGGDMSDDAIKAMARWSRRLNDAKKEAAESA